jgi:hypothetical protein
MKDFKAIGAKGFPSKVAVYGLLGIEYTDPGIPIFTNRLEELPS